MIVTKISSLLEDLMESHPQYFKTYQAKVIEFYLRRDKERNFLTYAIEFKYNGWHQNLCGEVLYLDPYYKHHNPASQCAGHFIYTVLKTFDIEQMTDLLDRTVIIKTSSWTGNEIIVGFKPLKGGEWIYPEILFRKLKEK